MEIFKKVTPHLDNLYKRQDYLWQVTKFCRILFGSLDTKTDIVNIGSSRMFVEYVGAFQKLGSPTLMEDLLKSDMDFAIQHNQFLLEELFDEFPSIKAKSKEVSYEGGDRRLKVYEISLEDLVKSPRGEILIKNYQKEFRSLEGDLKPFHLFEQFPWINLDIIFVEDIEAIRKIWDLMNPDIFAAHLWKHSPYYLGKEEVRKFFDMFESMSRVKKRLVVRGYDLVGGLNVQGPEWEAMEEAPVALDVDWGDNFPAQDGVALGNLQVPVQAADF